MADSKIIVEIITSDKGTKASIKNQEKLSKATDKTAKSTDRARKSRDKYNRVEKGAAGISSNSTKNFSKMQQSIGGDGGSGGLVRAYALLAANVFALTAAFGVLSRGAQVDTLIASIEQLEITSGKSIKSVGRDLQEASGFSLDFAASLRSVSLASSAGFGTEDIQRLGAVAKNASVSLGRNLADGLDRIFRGVIKVEPELLDEIGLFVRVNEAAAKYASELGIAATDLTEFQKRQAFLNEALEQGEDKFEAFAGIDPDAFSQIAAALTDVAQNAISFLNNGLVPIVQFLNENKGFLVAAFAGVAVAIGRQVLPAIGTFTTNARKSAEEAQSAFDDYTSDVESGLKRQSDAEIALLKNKKASADADIKRAKTVREGATSGLGGQGVKEANAQLEKAKTSNEKINALTAKRNALEKSRRKTTNDRINAEQKAIDNEIVALQQKKGIENEIARIKNTGQVQVAQGSEFDLAARKLELKLDRARRVEVIQTTAATQGYRAALNQLIVQTKAAANANKVFGTSFLSLQGALVATRGAATLLAGAFSRLMAALGPISIAMAFLAPVIAIVGKNLGFGSKEAEEFNKATERTNETFETLSEKLENVADNLAKATPNAMSGAFQALANTIQSSTEALEKQAEALVKLKELAEGEDGGFGSRRAARKAEEQLRKDQIRFIEDIIKKEETLEDNQRQAFKDNGVDVTAIATQRQALIDGQIAGQKKIKENEELIERLRLENAGRARKDNIVNSELIRKAQRENVLLKIKDRNINETLSTFIKDQLADTEDLGAAISAGNELTTEQVKQQENLKSALEGARDSARSFSDSFITKTAVDKPLSSLQQTVAALSEATAIDGTRAQEIKKIAKGGEAVNALLSKEVNELLKKALLLETEEEQQDEILKILTKAEESYRNQKLNILLIEQDLAAVNGQLKLFKSVSKDNTGAMRLQKVLLQEQRDLQQMLIRGEVLRAVQQTGLTEEQVQRLALLDNESLKNDELFIKSADQNKLLKAISLVQGEKNQLLEEEVKQATVIQELLIEESKLKLKILQEEKALNDEKAKAARFEAQVAKFREQGTVTLNASDEAKLKAKAFKIDRDNAKKKMAEEKAINQAKFDILKAELEVAEKVRQTTLSTLQARLAVLQKEGKDTTETQESINQISEPIGQATIDNLQARADVIGETIALKFANMGAEEFVKALDNSDLFSRDRGLAGKIAKRSQDAGAARARRESARETILTDVGASDRGAIESELKDLQGLGGAATEEQIKRIEELQKALGDLNAIDLAGFQAHLKTAQGTLSDFGDKFKEYGPEGEAAAAMANFAGSILNVVDAMASGDIASKFEAVGSSIAAFGQMIMAEAKANMAKIDEQIAAEKKRDGKSAESLQRIRDMEKKKEQINRAAFERDKKMRIASAVMDTIAGAVRMFADPGGLAGMILAGVVTALGMKQVSLIKKQKYNGFTAPEGPMATPTLSVGKRDNKIDVSQRASAGELAFLRGQKGVGTATNFVTGAVGRRNYADGGSVLVGERGPELITPTQPVDIIPNTELGQGKTTNVNFNINAVDGVSVQNMLAEQQGNIIAMIRQAANDHGETFLESVEDTSYGGA